MIHTARECRGEHGEQVGVYGRKTGDFFGSLPLGAEADGGLGPLVLLLFLDEKVPIGGKYKRPASKAAFPLELGIVVPGPGIIGVFPKRDTGPGKP
jgi:hypothetical protein